MEGYKTSVALYGRQNMNVIYAIQAAYKASLKLVQDGFTIINIKTDGGKPVIEIQNEPNCKNLTNATAISRTKPHGKENIKVALVEDTQVQWIERISG